MNPQTKDEVKSKAKRIAPYVAVAVLSIYLTRKVSSAVVPTDLTVDPKNFVRLTLSNGRVFCGILEKAA